MILPYLTRLNNVNEIYGVVTQCQPPPFSIFHLLQSSYATLIKQNQSVDMTSSPKTMETSQEETRTEHLSVASRLLGLPIELRHMILINIIDWRVTPHHSYPDKLLGGDPSHPDLRIALVNRQLCHEVRSVLYSEVCFKFSSWNAVCNFFPSGTRDPHYDIKYLALDMSRHELLACLGTPVGEHANRKHFDWIEENFGDGFVKLQSRLNLRQLQVYLPEATRPVRGGGARWMMIQWPYPPAEQDSGWLQTSDGRRAQWRNNQTIWEAAQPFVKAIPNVSFSGLVGEEGQTMDGWRC